MNPFSKNLENVTDATDWNASRVPAMSQFDSLQRCFICKEFLRAPVITGCNHTFCSHCIRQYLVSNSQCPLCHTEQFESNLRRDILLEEIVACYSTLRPQLLQLLNSSDSSTVENTLDDPVVISDDEVEPPAKRPKPSLSPPPATPAKQAKLATVPSEEDVVACPICSEQMSAQILQTSHIDECLKGGRKSRTYQLQKKRSPKPGISSFFQSVKPKKVDHENFYFNEVQNHQHDTKKLPKLDFSSLTTPKLKEKLAAVSLPTQGTRHQLELRYNQYYIIYNANLDSNHPLLAKVLKQKLNQWEHSHLAFSSLGSSLFSSGNNIGHKSITDKDFSVKLWMDAYGGEFSKLVRAARRNRKKESNEKNVNVSEVKNEKKDTDLNEKNENEQKEQIDQTDQTEKKETPTDPNLTFNMADSIIF